MKFHAPVDHGTWLCHPELGKWRDLLLSNTQLVQKYPDKIKKIRSLFQMEAKFGSDPVIMTGHQPDWFHPGVWAKNFLVHHLGKISGGSAVNCVIDTDVPKSFAWVIPASPKGDLPSGSISIPFMFFADRFAPWELQASVPISDFSQSLRKAIKVCRAWGYEPIASSFLDDIQADDVSGNAARQFSFIRRNAETKRGVFLKDHFISHFFSFKAIYQLLFLFINEIEASCFHYNRSIDIFRNEHCVRRFGSPIPLLEQNNEWFETPLWIYSITFPERSRLWIKRLGNELYVKSGNGVISDQFNCSNPDDLFSYFQKKSECGIYIRTRALMTSLILRLLASDLFVHGLGGSLYDQMTDRWIRGWLGVELPVSMTCSMTARLPLPKPRHTSREINQLRIELRKIQWHGETVRNESADQEMFRRFCQEKRQLIIWNPTDRVGKKERFRAFRLLNQKILDSHALLERNLLKTLDWAHLWIRDEKLITSREFPWILYPAKEIERIMMNMVAEISE